MKQVFSRVMALVLFFSLLAVPAFSAAPTSNFKSANIKTTGLITAGSLTVTGAQTFTGNTALNGNVTVGGTLGVTGIITAAAANAITHSNTGGLFLNPAGTFSVALTPSAEVANRVLTIPLLGAADTLMTLGTAQTVTGVKTMSGANVITMSNTGALIQNPAATFTVALTPSAEVASRVLTIPLLGGADTIMTNGTAQTVGGVKTMTGANVITHANAGLLVQNPAATFTVQLTPSAEVASRVLTIPLLGGADTIMTLGTAQANTGIKTCNDGTIVMKVGSGGTEVLNPAGVIFTQLTQVATAANTTETDGATKTVAANTLSGNGKALRFKVWGFTANTANLKTVKLYWNGVAVYTSTTTSQSKAYVLEMTVIRTSSNNQRICVSGTFNDAAIPAVSTTGTATDTAGIIIKNTMTNGTAAASDITTDGATLEALP